MGSRFVHFTGILFVALLLCLTLAAQSAPSPASSALVPATLRIAPGDLLEIGVFDSPELSAKARVSEDGDVSLPVGGGIHLQGLTAEAAATAIEERLQTRDIMPDPHVSVFISEYATQGVTVTGEVKTPGIYPLLGAHGLLDMISAAGGPIPTASRQATVIHRSDPQHPEVVSLDFHAGSSAAANYPIQPGDTVVLARAGVVYVVGDVGRPGGFLLEQSQHLSVLQVISLAGGANRTAATQHARLFRGGDGERTATELPVRKMLHNEAPDMLVADGDIIYIPPSGSKVFGNKTLDAILAMTTGVVVYAAETVK